MKLIDKDVAVAEIKRLRDYLQEKVVVNDFITGEVFIMNYLISFLDSLEVKEVDLDGEINLWVRNLHRVPNFEELNKFARHFFELGLKAQKGK